MNPLVTFLLIQSIPAKQDSDGGMDYASEFFELEAKLKSERTSYQKREETMQSQVSDLQEQLMHERAYTEALVKLMDMKKRIPATTGEERGSVPLTPEKLDKPGETYKAQAAKVEEDKQEQLEALLALADSLDQRVRDVEQEKETQAADHAARLRELEHSLEQERFRVEEMKHHEEAVSLRNSEIDALHVVLREIEEDRETAAIRHNLATARWADDIQEHKRELEEKNGKFEQLELCVARYDEEVRKLRVVLVELEEERSAQALRFEGFLDEVEEEVDRVLYRQQSLTHETPDSLQFAEDIADLRQSLGRARRASGSIQLETPPSVRSPASRTLSGRTHQRVPLKLGVRRTVAENSAQDEDAEVDVSDIFQSDTPSSGIFFGSFEEHNPHAAERDEQSVNDSTTEVSNDKDFYEHHIYEEDQSITKFVQNPAIVLHEPTVSSVGDKAKTAFGAISAHSHLENKIADLEAQLQAYWNRDAQERRFPINVSSLSQGTQLDGSEFASRYDASTATGEIGR